MCNVVKGCPDNRAWAIVSPTAIHRITFSKALADHALRGSGAGFEVRRVKLFLGNELPRGETSSSGAYAIIDRRKGKTLRVALSREIAEVLCDYQSRFVREVFVSVNQTQTERESHAKAA